MPAKLLAPVVPITIGLLTAIAFSTALAQSDYRDSVLPNGETPTASLRRLCREEGAETLVRPSVNASTILQNKRGREACNRLIETSGLQGRDLAVILLDRADLEAPGQEEAYTRAMADYKRAIALAPGLATAFWRRGKANLLYSRNLTAALNDLNQAVRLDSSQAEFLVTRSSIRSWLGQPDLAIADLNRALSIDPNSVDALTNRGLAYFNSGDINRAVSDFDAALQLSPSDAGLYRIRSAARRQAGDEAGAKIDEARMAELMFKEGSK